MAVQAPGGGAVRPKEGGWACLHLWRSAASAHSSLNQLLMLRTEHDPSVLQVINRLWRAVAMVPVPMTCVPMAKSPQGKFGHLAEQWCYFWWLLLVSLTTGHTQSVYMFSCRNMKPLYAVYIQFVVVVVGVCVCRGLYSLGKKQWDIHAPFVFLPVICRSFQRCSFH